MSALSLPPPVNAQEDGYSAFGGGAGEEMNEGAMNLDPEQENGDENEDGNMKKSEELKNGMIRPSKEIKGECASASQLSDSLDLLPTIAVAPHSLPLLPDLQRSSTKPLSPSTSPPPQHSWNPVSAKPRNPIQSSPS